MPHNWNRGSERASEQSFQQDCDIDES
jgi:hypothetical protein